ncbi:Cna B-type domain-containing protein [Coprococcus sp. NSJ-10]|uniref:Cna B-type domain-containing protein n=2 Tax=Coprococcus TaxID=33042 RepID=A0A8I0DVD7_9FIRM|nr:Cna B-type domain-containing protein [Coprococcus hominis (ex Liu et al. 2022)]MBC5663086.1 Cna B-type domain-containing protein [Coprococcus hominis (ex Liu et al. 2022)]
MFKMKRQWKRIISTIMAALMVVTVIPSSFGSSSAAEIATPGDADQTGYVKIEAKLPESDKKGEDVTGIVYEVYMDASCKDEVGTFVLSCDGKAYSNKDNEPVVYADQEEINEKKLSSLELPAGTYYYRMDEMLYKSEKKVSDQNICYDDQIYTFSLTAKATKKKAVVLKPEITFIEQTATPSDAEEASTSDDGFTVVAGSTESTETATPSDANEIHFLSPFALFRTFAARVAQAGNGYYARRIGSSYITPQMRLQDSDGKDMFSVYCGDHNKDAANYYTAGTNGDPVTLHTYGASSGSPLSALGNNNVVKTLYYGYKNGNRFEEMRKNLDYYRHGTANGNTVVFDVTDKPMPTNKYNADIQVGTVSLTNKTVTYTNGVETTKEIGPSGDDYRYKHTYTISKSLIAETGNGVYDFNYTFSSGKFTSKANAGLRRTNIYKVQTGANSYTFKVPTSVTCYTTEDAVQTKGIAKCTWASHAAGSSVTFTGGTYFMFVAKKTYAGTSSINATASKDGFVAYWAVPDNSSIQNLFGAELYEYALDIDIDWEKEEQPSTGRFELTKEPADGTDNWNYKVYNMAGIRYVIYSDKACTTSVSSAKNYKRSDGVPVGSATQIVLSYNGKAYMDAFGKNVIFVSKAAKDAFKESHDLYTYRWYKDDLESGKSYTYYYKEAGTLAGGSGNSYYYDNGTAETKALITKHKGQNISVTNFELNTNVKSFTFKAGDSISVVSEKTIDTKKSFTGSFRVHKEYQTEIAGNSYYNMAGIKYGIYASEGGSTVTADAYTKKIDGSDVAVQPANRLVLSYDGYSYMDANGRNVVFVNAAAKNDYASAYGSTPGYWWYKTGLTKSVSYYYHESEHLLGINDQSGAAYYYNPGGKYTKEINAIAGKSVEVTGFTQDIAYHKFTIKVDADASGNAGDRSITSDTTDDLVSTKSKATKSYSGSAAVLKGVQFKLYKVTGNGAACDNNNLVGTYVHDGTKVVAQADSIKLQGVTTGTGSEAEYFKNLPFGWYCLVEDAATANARGFSTAAPAYLECTSSHTSLNFQMSDVRSGLKLKKKLANTPLNKLCNYNLDGAEYKAYTTTGNGVETTDAANYLCTFRTDTAGNGYVIDTNKSRNLELADQSNGNYYKLVGVPLNTWVCIKETKNSTGCELDTKVYYLYYTEDNMQQTVTSTEPLKNDPLRITITKKDSTSGSNAGATSLAGAEFTIKYYDVPVTGAGAVTSYAQVKGKAATRTWVYRTDENGELHTVEPDKYLVKDASSELFYDDGYAVIPLGAITIEETKAPEGYTLAGSFYKKSLGGEVASNEDGVIFVAVKDAHSLSNYFGENAIIKEEKVLRADLKFKKIALDTNEPLSGIVFKITSKTTGESHVVVTDANGMIDTSKIKHSENTNAADTDSKTIGGTWFYGNKDGNGTVDDTLGALPFDTYEITEIATDTNTEYRLITPITVDLTKEADYTDGYQLYDLGTVTNIPEPYIGTRALGVKTQDNIIPANEKVDVEDISDYHFLEAGKTYTMKGVIKDPETGKAYKQPDGTYSLGHKVFTTDSDDTGYVSAEVRTPLVLDTTGLDGKNVVVAEYLFEGSDDTDLTINEDGTVDETGVYQTHTGRLVKHDDLTSKSQTLSVPKITKISVKKVWNDADNADGIRPESIKVQLYKNGNTKVYDAVELSEKNNWSYTWEGLPTMENNEDIIYAVDEVEIPAGYEKEVTNKETKFIITNTHVPDVTKISVEKVWDDNNDQDGIRPTTIKVQLYADGKASGRMAELSENNGWKYTWKDLDKQKDGEDIVYTVDEIEIPDGYTKTVTNKGAVFTITNTHKPGTTEVKVTKVWKDSNDKYQKRPGSIEVQLYKSVAGKIDAVGNPVELSENNGWKYTWSNLAKQEKGVTIIYSVDEVEVPEGYSKTVVRENDGKVVSFVITNSRPDTPKTGDAFKLIPVAFLMAAAFITGAFVIWRKKRRK